MATPLVCGKCGRLTAYLRGGDAAAIARCLAGDDDGPAVRCPDCAVGKRRARRLCKCGHPFPYHASNGEVGPCIWSDWSNDDRGVDKPFPCECDMYDEAEEA